MFFTKYCKNPRKIRIILLFMIVTLIIITLLILNNGLQHVNPEKLINERFVAQAYAGPPQLKPQQNDDSLVILKSPRRNGVIQPEKYDDGKLKSRLIDEKIHNLKEQSKQLVQDPEEEHSVMETLTTAIHIFYTAPVQWYKIRKTTQPKEIFGDFSTTENVTKKPSAKVLNSAFYPAMGLYKPTYELFEKHFQNIRNCGVGVLILSYTGKSSELDVYKTIFQVASKFNLSITFEISVAANQSLPFLQQHVKDIRKFYDLPAFYKVYSQSRKASTPVIYISNAYKLIDSVASQAFCKKSSTSIRLIIDAFYIGHIRLKNHADYIRRLCLDGFYSKLPSNGATFASTWKNWSYLKSFALTYKMLFVPTVGPGFAERNKFPRHGDIQRHRSNGRYYGVAWRTAILNHVGFINIASYNNWPDGSQIEEAIPKAGFLDYNPGVKSKYLDLTTHWVGNFIKTRNEAASASIQSDNGPLNCYEYLSNTIC